MHSALYVIGWFVGLLISIALVYNWVGMAGLTAMFPEGRRWWHIPVQLLTLILFAFVILHHPFK